MNAPDNLVLGKGEFHANTPIPTQNYSTVIKKLADIEAVIQSLPEEISQAVIRKLQNQFDVEARPAQQQEPL